jgi:uracil-DNA glycosylase
VYDRGMNKEERSEALKAIRDDLLHNEQLPLFAYRNANKYFPVVGEGDHFARIVFIGEAPGKNEAMTARPFCGASGKILDQLLESVGLKRENIYITNIVKDRPQENRDPLPHEIEAYGPYLDRQLEIIQPKVIATLGRFSMEYIMRKFGLAMEVEPISKAHGKSSIANCKWGQVNIIPLYHPAAAIYNQHLKDTLKKDFEVMKEFAEL